nr:DUF2142 domain-containing protein [Pararhodospirillum photometricum]
MPGRESASGAKGVALLKNIFTRLISLSDRFERRRGPFLAILFLGVAVPACLFYTYIVPPGQVADETAHALRVHALSHGVVFGHRASTVHISGQEFIGSGIKGDPALYHMGFIILRGEVISRNQLLSLPLTPWTGEKKFYEIGPIATYLPHFYLPSAALVALARPVVDSPYGVFIIGRLGSLLAFVTLGAAALTVARRGHLVLLCTLCVPMTLSLAGSLNQDGVIIATSVLGAALLTRQDPSRPALHQGAWWGAGAAFLAVALAKPPYFPLLALLLLPWPGLVRQELTRRLLVIAGGCALAIGWAILAQGTMGGQIIHPPAVLPNPAGGPDLVYPGPNPKEQARYLLAHPALILTLPWKTLLADATIPLTMIGVLGWLQVLMPTWYYGFCYGALAVAMVGDSCREAVKRIAWAEAALALLVLFACIEGIYLSQYLVWTHLHYPSVQGPQGRYLLPLLPLTLFLLPALREGRRGWPFLALAPVAAAVLGLVAAPLAVVTAFYAR